MLLQFLFLEQLYTINVGNPQTVGDLKPFIQRKVFSTVPVCSAHSSQINVPVQYQDIRLDGKQLKDSDVVCPFWTNSFFIESPSIHPISPQLTEIGLNENSLLLIIPLEAQKQSIDSLHHRNGCFLIARQQCIRHKQIPCILDSSNFSSLPVVPGYHRLVEED